MNIQHVEYSIQDGRGTIADILEDEPIEHVTVIESKTGAVRGNHVHRETHQWVYVVTGKLRGFSTERLLRMLARLGRDIDIVIRPSKGKTGRVSVIRR